MRATARTLAGYADIGASRGSAYIIAKAMLENDFSIEMSRFRAEAALRGFSERNALLSEALKVRLSRDGDRTRAVLQGASAMLQLLQLQVQSLGQQGQLHGEVNRVKLISKVEEAARNVELDLLDEEWNLELYQQGANILAALGGTSTSQKRSVNNSGRS